MLSRGVNSKAELERFVQHGQMVVANPLDNYTSDATVAHRKLRVAPNKMVGWKRLMGQEVPIEGYSDLATISGASAYPSLGTGTGLPANASLSSRQVVQLVAGAQTPKATQPALDIWAPLTLF